MSDQFEVEKDGAITTLRFLPSSQLLASKLPDRDALLRVLYDTRRSGQKVLMLDFPEDGLGPDEVDKLGEQGRSSRAEGRRPKENRKNRLRSSRDVR
jgi:hypothetical protein